CTSRCPIASSSFTIPCGRLDWLENTVENFCEGVRVRFLPAFLRPPSFVRCSCLFSGIQLAISSLTFIKPNRIATRGDLAGQDYQALKARTDVSTVATAPRQG